MKLNFALTIIIAGLIAAVAAYAVYSKRTTDDLGLSRSDLVIGGLPNIEVLRIKTKSVADAYLAQNDDELKRICGEPFVITVDYSLSRKIRSLGFRSSFYYYCWDIYVPYSLVSQSGKKFTVLVQVSDATPGNSHNTDSFHVVRGKLINAEDQIVASLE